MTCTNLFTELLSRFDNARNRKGVKFSLFMTHDVFLASLLQCLRIKTRPEIIFSSNLIIEFYADETIKAYFNDIPLELPYCRSWPCPAYQFEENMRSYIVDYDEGCKLK